MWLILRQTWIQIVVFYATSAHYIGCVKIFAIIRHFFHAIYRHFRIIRGYTDVFLYILATSEPRWQKRLKLSMMFLSTTVLWIVSALLSSTQVIGGQQKSATQLFKGYQGETIHSTFACQTYKFKIVKRGLQSEYATHIIESATFRLRTEWTIELLNQFGDKKLITQPIVQFFPNTVL